MEVKACRSSESAQAESSAGARDLAVSPGPTRRQHHPRESLDVTRSKVDRTAYVKRMNVRRRVAVYVERGNALLVFEHRDRPDAGTQIPAGGLEPGETPEAGVVREVLEETGLRLSEAPSLLGTHDHFDGLGRPSRTYFFRVQAPQDAPESWEHHVTGDGDDTSLVFLCRFDPAPSLWPVQAIHRPGSKLRQSGDR